MYWLDAYLVVGILIAEVGMDAVLRLKKDYTAGTYLITVLAWPLIVLMAMAKYYAR